MSEAIDYNKLLTKEEFESRLRNIGETRYHNLHPFHKLLHGGKLNKGQVQAWALNRYYYQCSIPIKDSVVMSRMKDPELRRIWRKRIIDHDGESAETGGIERWYKLTDGLGLDREYVKSTDGILSTTRFAVDAYVNFADKIWDITSGETLIRTSGGKSMIYNSKHIKYDEDRGIIASNSLIHEELLTLLPNNDYI